MAKRKTPQAEGPRYGLTPATQFLLYAPLPYDQDDRYQLLHKREQYFGGTAYDDRAYNWDKTLNVGNGRFASYQSTEHIPESQRRPSAPYHLGRPIINRFVSMLVGEQRFPRIRVAGDPDSEEFLQKIAESIELKAHFTEAATLGGSIGSVMVSFKLVNGEFRLEVTNSKWVLPIWEDFQLGILEAARIMYPFKKHVYNPEKSKWETKWFLYRRIITKTHDVTFKEQELKDPERLTLRNEKEVPVPAEGLNHTHNLGFVPGVFIQNLPNSSETDGDGLLEGSYDLIDRICENLSAIDHALKGNLDPTLLLKLSPEDWKKLQTMGGILQTGSDGACLVVGDKGDAKYLEFTGDSIEVALKILCKMREWVLEETDCVMADPERISGNAQSAAAIIKLYAHMIAKTDQLRTQYGDRGIKRLLGLMLKAIQSTTGIKAGEDGTLRNYVFQYPKKIDPETKKRKVLKPDPELSVADITLQWGEYFEPATSDVFQAVQAASVALGGKPVSTVELLVKYLAPFLHDNDPINTTKLVEAMLEDMQKQEEKANAKKEEATSKADPQQALKPKGADNGRDS